MRQVQWLWTTPPVVAGDFYNMAELFKTSRRWLELIRILRGRR